jgi:hypothetical protein
MKTPRILALAAAIIFVISHFLPAYGTAPGFACFDSCWRMLLGDNGDVLSGGWFYYSGFAIANNLFIILTAALFVTNKYRKLRLAISVVCFLHVFSWLIAHLLQQPPKIDKIKIGYYLWLVAYGLLVAAHFWNQPTESRGPTGRHNPAQG